MNRHRRHPTRRRAGCLLAATAALALSGCGERMPAAGDGAAAEPAAGPSQESRRDVLAGLTRADLAKRLGKPEDEVRVLEVREVTWRSAALGCPAPDRAYAQVLTQGYLIRLAAGGVEYRYHAGRSGQPFMCPPSQAEPWLDSSVD